MLEYPPSSYGEYRVMCDRGCPWLILRRRLALVLTALPSTSGTISVSEGDAVRFGSARKT
jgi:hypothetical protein